MSAQTPPIDARDGGPDFREKLIELIPFLRAFARTLSGHRNEADDLCQEALVKAWQSRASFEPGTHLKAWLFMILRNQFYSDKRRSWRTQPWDEELAEQRLVTHGGQESAVALSEVARAMRLLPNEQREALILIGAGGFQYEEAAKICGCAVGTIKSRVARARRALEATVGGDGPTALPRGASRGESDIMAELERLSPAGSVAHHDEADAPDRVK